MMDDVFDGSITPRSDEADDVSLSSYSSAYSEKVTYNKPEPLTNQLVAEVHAGKSQDEARVTVANTSAPTPHANSHNPPNPTESILRSNLLRQKAGRSDRGERAKKRVTIANDRDLKQIEELVVPTAKLKVISPDGKAVKVIPLKDRASARSSREIQTEELTQPVILGNVLKQSGAWTVCIFDLIL